MPAECLVIAIIVGCLSFYFFRAKRKNWGFAVLPLTVIPLVVGTVMYVVTTFTKISFSFLLPMSLVLGSLTASCIWLGISSVVLVKTPRLRVYYLTVSVFFCVTLSFIILLRYYIELCM